MEVDVKTKTEKGRHRFGPRVKSGQLALLEVKLHPPAAAREGPGPRDPFMQAGQVIVRLLPRYCAADSSSLHVHTLDCTVARCSAAVHHLTYLLRDGVTGDAAVCLFGGDIFVLLLSTMGNLHVSHVRVWSTAVSKGGVSTLRWAPRRASG